jgi:8-oxo-dGTP diphosphatase
VAAAVFNVNSEVLIARRPNHIHQGGKWEFPGGKVEPGERARDALCRELFEELGIRAQTFEPLIRIRHHYPDKAVLLDVWKVTHYTSEPHGREGQALTWSAPQDLSRFTFPAANYPILKALILPELYLITPEPGYDDASFLDCLKAALRQGIRLVQLRAPALEVSRYCELAAATIQCCHAHGARLLINGEPEWAMRLNADGVHLNSVRLRATHTRPLPKHYLVAASCHDQGEIARANAIDADLAVVAPVKATPSHPDAKPLGWRVFQDLCADATMPVYALGGMSASDLRLAKRSGGQGIAAIRALWPD